MRLSAFSTELIKFEPIEAVSIEVVFFLLVYNINKKEVFIQMLLLIIFKHVCIKCNWESF